MSPPRMPPQGTLQLLSRPPSGGDQSPDEQLSKMGSAAPPDLEALQDRRRLYLADAKWAALADVLEQIADASPDLATQLNSWREAAVVHEQMLRDDESAANCWRQIAERQPNDRDAARALERLYAAQDLPEGLAFALKLRRAQEGNGPGGRDLAVRLALLKAERFGALADAVAVCREVLAADPTHQGALEALQSWAGEPIPEGAAALQVLDEALSRTGDARRRITVREQRSLRVDQSEAGRLASEMMHIWDQELGDQLQALMAGMKAFAAGFDRVILLPTLARLARETCSLEELSEVVEASADLLPPGHPDLPPLLRCAAELREELGHGEVATQLWNDLLAESPGDGDALDRLARFYERSGDARNLSEVFARKAKAASDPEHRRATWLKAGAAYEMAGQNDEAIGAFRAALQLGPHAEALAGLDRLHGKAGRFLEQAEVLLELADLSSSPEMARTLHLRRGRTLEQAREKRSAAQAYARALHISSTDGEAVSGLERLLGSPDAQREAACALEQVYRQRQELRKLVEVLELRVEGTAPAEQGPILEELASAWETLGELHLAFTARLRCFVANPADGRHRAELERLGRQTGLMEEVLAAYQDQLDRGVDDALGAALWRASALLSESADDGDFALLAWEEALRRNPGDMELLRARPDHPEAISVLEEMMRSAAPIRAQAAALLEPILQRSGDSANLLEALEAMAANESSPAKKVVLLHRIADLRAGALRLPDAFEAAAEALRLLPDDSGALEKCVALSDGTDLGGPLAQVLEQILPRVADASQAARVSLALGAALERGEPQGGMERALRAYQRVLDLEPSNQQALRALEALYEREGKAEPLFAVLEQLSSLLTGPDRERARMKMAHLADQGLWDAARAMALSREVLSENPSNEQAFEMLTVLLERGQRHDELKDLLHARIAVAVEPRALIDLHHRLADLLYRAKSSPIEAVPHYQAVIERDPAHVASLEALRGIYEKLGREEDLAQVLAALAKLPLEPEKLREIRIGLANVLIELGRRQESLDVARLALDASANDVALLFELSSLLSRLGDPRGAAAALERIAAVDPSHRAAYDAARELYAAEGDWAACARVLSSYLAHLAPEEKIASLEKLAEIQEQKLGRKGEAFSTACEALRMRPKEPRWRELVQRLAEETGAHQALADLYSAVADSLPRGPPAEEMYRALARVQDERLDRPEAAVVALQRALELCTDPRERSQIQLQIADLLERKLGDPDAAASAYRCALELDPTSAGAFAALERLYAAMARPEQTLSLYEQRLAVAQDEEERVRLLSTSADLWETRCGDRLRADACLEAVLQIRPGDLRAIEGLKRIRRAEERWEALAFALQRQIQVSADPLERAQLSFEQGEIFLHKLSDLERAAASWRKVLELQPDHRAAIHGLASLHGQSGRWLPALQMLEREAELETDPAAAAELHHRMARMREEHLNDSSGAQQSEQRALELLPGYLPSLQSLRALYLAERNWVGYERTLIEETAHATTAEAKHRAAMAVARHVVQQRGDPSAATPWYEQALGADPESVEAAAPLAEIYLAKQDWVRGEKMLEIVVQRRAADPRPHAGPELCEQLCRLAEVALRLDKKPKALAAYQEATRQNPEHFGALRGQAELLFDLGRLQEALDSHQQLIAQHRGELSAAQKVDVYFRLAGIEQSLGKPEAAWGYLEHALGIDPDHVPSLRALVAIAERSGQFDSAAAHRQHLAEVLQGEERFQAYVELGALARETLSNPQLAVTAYLKALEVKPDTWAVLEALFESYRDSAQPLRAAAALDALLRHPEAQSHGPRRIQLQLALGEIAAGPLGDVDRAAAAFGAALQIDPLCTDALRGLESLLRAQQRWRQLEQLYLQVARRLDGAAHRTLRGSIWRSLAELRFGQLHDRASALPAYQAAAADLPDELGLQETFADIGIDAVGYEDNAIAAYLRALPAMADPAKACSAATRLATRRGNDDAAYFAARIQECFFDRVGPGERKLLQRLASRGSARTQAQNPVSDQLWKTRLLHPAVRGPLGELLAVLFQLAGAKYAAPLSEYGVNAKRHRIDLATAGEPVLKHLRGAARMLGTESFELYSPYLAGREKRTGWRPVDLLQLGRGAQAARDRTIALAICQTQPFSLVAGGRLFDPQSAAELDLMIGSTLALLRPELALAQRLPWARLQAVLQAAIGLSSDARLFEIPEKELRKERKALEKTLDQAGRASLDRAVRAWLKVATSDELPRFLEGTELTALRAAMFVLGDPEPIKRKLLAEIGPGPKMDAQVRELIAFVISGDLAALRAEVGLGLAAA